MSSFDILKKSYLTYKLTDFSIRQLLFLDKAPADIYILDEGVFKLEIKQNDLLDRGILKSLVSKGHTKVFLKIKDKGLLVKAQQEGLRRVTRSLSIGDPKENGRKQMNLLTIHLEFIYQNPTDDDNLNLQYQSIKNLATFLINHLDIHVSLYRSFLKQKHHFVFAQPMISSLFLVGVLKSSKLFSDREIEALFITSYFKDIGMSAIPTEKYDQKTLSEAEKSLFFRHPMISVEILSGRLALSPSHFKIIENHHAFSLLKKEIHQVDMYEQDYNETKQILSGTETILVCATDTIAAMITGRPFREATTLFDALDFIKVLISDDYPQEFKVMVNYFKHFNT